MRGRSGRRQPDPQGRSRGSSGRSRHFYLARGGMQIAISALVLIILIAAAALLIVLLIQQI